MNEEIEIDLKQLFYLALKQYKKIIVCATIVAIAFGGFKLFQNLSVINNEESFAKETKKYEQELFNYNKNCEVAFSELEYYNDNFEQSVSEYNDYLNNSIYINIDPNKEYKKNFELYIRNNSIDDLNKIFSLYKKVLNEDYLINNLPEVYECKSETKYILELISYNFYINDSVIDVSVIGGSQDEVDSLSNAVLTLINSNYNEISNKYYHTCEIVEGITYNVIDNNIRNKKDSIENNISKLVDEINTAKEKYGKISENNEPVFEYSTSGIIISTIKFALIGLVVGIFAVGAYYAIKVVISNPVQKSTISRNEIVELGKIVDNNYKADYIDTLFDSKNVKYSEACDIVASNLKKTVTNSKKANFAFISTDTGKTVSRLCDDINEVGIIKAEYVGNILNSADAIRDCDKYDNFVIVLHENATPTVEFVEQITKLKEWNKNIVGAVLFKH